MINFVLINFYQFKTIIIYIINYLGFNLLYIYNVNVNHLIMDFNLTKKIIIIHYSHIFINIIMQF